MSLDTKKDSVFLVEPVLEWSGINRDDTVFNQGVSPEKLIACSVVNNLEDLGLPGDVVRLPEVVAVIEAKGTELEVSSPGTDSSDLRSSESGIGLRAALLKGSFLFMDRHAPSGFPSLVPGIA